MSSMDPFDEFEFKPLTEGLGFHKKTVSLKEGLKNTGVLDEELQTIPASVPKSLLDPAPKPASKKHTFEDVLSALEKAPLKRTPVVDADLQFTEPLPRVKKQTLEIDLPQAPLKSPFPGPEAFKTPGAKKQPVIPDFMEPPSAKVKPNAGTRRGAADSPQRGLRPEPVSFASAALDGIIVFALALVFLIALVLVTKVDLNAIIKNLNKDFMTQVSLGALVLAVMQMYMIIARSFFGRSLGEWTFDLQIGKDEEQKKEIYPLRVALRSLVNVVTGLAVLPVLSAIVGYDLAGRISRVELYRHR